MLRRAARPARVVESPPAPDVILLTGATGFVGRAVAARLRGRQVLALARGKGGQSAGDRLSAAGVTGVVVLEGALGGDLSGLRDLDIETVIHCAGDPTFFPKDPDAYRNEHVEGALALYEAVRARNFAHVSTAFVCGDRTGTIREGESDLGQAFHNPYEETKLEIEKALRGVGGRDLRILRPSIIVGDAPATTGGGPSEAVFGFARHMAQLAWHAKTKPRQLRITGKKLARFNLVPVEYVADAIVALADDPAADGGTFHLVSDAPTLEEYFGVVAELAALPGLRVVEPRRGTLTGMNRHEVQLHAWLGKYLDYLGHDATFDDAVARSLLARHGITPPSLRGAALVRIVDRAMAR